jgi:CubicO group peptidase (beta-lactamase class C family)
MMKRIFFICTLLISFASAQTVEITEAKLKSIDSLFKLQFPATEPGTIMILAKDGKPIMRKAYGMSNIELNVALNTDQKMGIGSISKQFTAVAILLLQQENKLNVKDDIRKYLPQYNTWGRTITIEQILSHTSGIPSYTELPGFDTLADKKVSNSRLIKFFESSPLIFEPGSNWSYSNSGFVLAGIIVEKLTGQPFNDFVEERILRKLNMTNSTFGTSNYALLNKTAEYAGNSPKGKIKMEPQYDWYWAYGAGQIISTVDDMLKWDEALYSKDFMQPELLKVAHTSYQLTTGNPANYGLGWGIAPFGNKTMVQHGGAIGGYRAQGIRIPDDHLYFLVMSNSGTTNSGLIGNKVMSILYDVAPAKEQRNQIQNWKEIEGVYESLNNGSRLQNNYGNMKAFFTIRVDSMNRITVQRSSNAPITLTAAGKDQLFDKSNPFVVWNLNRDANNKVVSYSVNPLIPSMGPIRVNNRIAESSPALKQPAKADSTRLAKYIGLYEYVLGTRTKLVIANHQLYMEDPEFGTKTQLHWLRDNIFWIKELDREVVFLTDKKGVVNALEYSNGMQMIKMSLINELY